jgi:hypothetical protein
MIANEFITASQVVWAGTAHFYKTPRALRAGGRFLAKKEKNSRKICEIAAYCGQNLMQKSTKSYDDN